MTEIHTITPGRRRPGMNRLKRNSPKTDMTPMVDLGFILITFFVMTVQLSKPMVVNLNMSKDGLPTTVGKSNALTALLDDNNRIYYYHGDWKEAYTGNEIFTTSFSVTGGFGKIIREKQKWLNTHDKKEGSKGLMLFIKAGRGASYQNVIDALDEAMINGVKKYAVLSAEREESDWMKQQAQIIFY